MKALTTIILFLIFFQCFGQTTINKMEKEKSLELTNLATEKLTLSGNIPKERLEIEFQKAYKEFFELINQALYYDSTNTYALYWKGKVELQNGFYEESLKTFEKYSKIKVYDFNDDQYLSVNETLFLLKKKLQMTNFEENLNVIAKISNDRLVANPKNSENLTLKLTYLLFSDKKKEAISLVTTEKENLGNETYFLEMIKNFKIENMIDNINGII